MSDELIFLVNTFCTFFLTGLIWVIQLVHYPSFRFVKEPDFAAFHRHHSFSIGVIVMPLMITELITSFLLFLSDSWFGYQAIGFYLVVLIWISTAALSVPAHASLGSGRNPEAIEKLISTNWFRTLFWTIKSAIGLLLVYKLIA